MSLQDITGKPEGELTTSVKAAVRFSLSNAWLAYCQALNLDIADVQALAAQGSVVAAHHRLLRLIAGTGTGASRPTQPLSRPFACGPQQLPVDQGDAQCPVLPDAVVAAPTLSAASGVPTAGLAATASAAALRALPVSPAGKSRRFRPLVRSRLLLVPSLSAPRISMQFFVLKQVCGGTSNAAA